MFLLLVSGKVTCPKGKGELLQVVRFVRFLYHYNANWGKVSFFMILGTIGLPSFLGKNTSIIIPDWLPNTLVRTYLDPKNWTPQNIPKTPNLRRYLKELGIYRATNPTFKKPDTHPISTGKATQLPGRFFSAMEIFGSCFFLIMLYPRDPSS